jgi:Ni2+-binding GTPase involved in maturation of urease and hydrogenase
MEGPKKLTVTRPVKLIFVGGFLGSGKTTALGALTRDLIRKGKRIGIITNDQSGNLADTLIVRQMLDELDVPVEEVVEGCFCCRFDELVNQMEKILAHDPDFLMGEPVGSCTDFVAAVAHPIKIHYKDAFIFAPFSTMVDPDRVRELMLHETETTFPEEVAYLFHKQLEEADLIVLNKIDLNGPDETKRLKTAIEKEFPGKHVMSVSAKNGNNMAAWLDVLLSERPGAGTVLRQIDYDRYAAAEAVLGWLNAAVKLSSEAPVATERLLFDLMVKLRSAFREKKAGIGHLKCALTSSGRSMWINLTDLSADPVLSDKKIGLVTTATLIVNVRVKMEPDNLENIFRDSLSRLAGDFGLEMTIIDLQCFSPAYPAPPYLMRDPERSQTK